VENKLGFSLLAGAVLAVSSLGCGNPCGAHLSDCGGYCANLDSDETDCGGCGLSCDVGDFCDQGVCIVGVCTDDGAGCSRDSECCSDYCASDGNCGCIPTGNDGCASSSDCCSGHCAHDGVCDP
jgi:hypothetical protein